MSFSIYRVRKPKESLIHKEAKPQGEVKMSGQLTTCRAVTKSGRTEHFSAYTESDDYQQATSWAGDYLLEDFYEV